MLPNLVIASKPGVLVDNGKLRQAMVAQSHSYALIAERITECICQEVFKCDSKLCLLE